MRQAELNLSYTGVTAPVSGVSGRAVHSEGSLVTPGADGLLTTISQVDPIWVRFSLAESDFAKLPQRRLVRGAQVEVQLALPDGTPLSAARGGSTSPRPRSIPELGTVQMRAEFDNANAQLLPGPVRDACSIVAGQRENVFLVPQAAVIADREGAHACSSVDEEGKAAPRPVQTGDWIGTDWVVWAASRRATA